MLDLFNQPVNRKKDHALKWLLYPEDTIPLWIADSDYPASPAIRSRLKQYADNTILGYQLAEHTTELNEAAVQWLARRYGWDIEPDWLVWVPGVMVAVNACVSVFSDKGIIVQTPNYPPILNLGKTHNSTIDTIATAGKAPDWQLDLNALETSFKQQEGSVFVLTNPMNPCGTVYKEAHLQQIAELCLKYNITLCSDEVHCDLILDESRHIPAGSIDTISDQSITIMSASKTFNVAGLATAYAVIPNPTMRKRFYHHTIKQQFWVNPFGMQATIAAYTECDEWYDAQLEHLRVNQALLKKACDAIDGLNYQPASATYLAWIDASQLNTNQPHKYFLDRKVGLSDGVEFGDSDYLRLNFACPTWLLEDALARMAQ